MIEYVILEFPRPLYNVLGELTDARRGWFPSSDAAGITAALESGAVEVGRTVKAAEMERLLELERKPPCLHPGCYSHVTHPCEGCGRIQGLPVRSDVRPAVAALAVGRERLEAGHDEN